MSSASSQKNLPLREIPGGYGLPFFGAIKDRYDFFYNLGVDRYFRTRMEKYKSTVFRCNMPPGPFMAKNSKVVALVDAVSFPILFDVSKVEKRDIFQGTYMASTKFTGGHRVCSFLDPSEPKHATLKALFLRTLAKLHHRFLPLFSSVTDDIFAQIEGELGKKGESNFNNVNDVKAFEFLFRLYCNDVKPADTKLGANAGNLVTKWLLPQIAPVTSLGLKWLPGFIEDLFLHTFPIPFFLVKSHYDKMYDAFHNNLGPLLDDAEKAGLKRDEACHNFVFFVCFNSYAAFKFFLPELLKHVGSAGEALHRHLAEEIRRAVEREGGKITVNALNNMPLTESAIWEALRIEPPIRYQYAKAKEDIIIQSHDASYLVKKGETIFGFQPFATKDPKIFENPDKYIPDRFVGEGKRLIEYVYWSNGKGTDIPGANDKQCLGREMIILLSRLFLAELFLRYDTFVVEVSNYLFSYTVTFKSLTKASSST
ncbi:allene oxide synthase 3-like [Ipomoea triloba]|uniref:allene oxide synthase 3-like n=1 Tax=Ipomoea triloba TaxID=35885 RepID=UPI00125CE42F|nr:allene oxide synthase 3-like [Ipomoea triloba]